MSAPDSKTPWYQSRWFWVLALLMIGLRFGYKMWQQNQRPSYETTLERLEERNQKLKEQLQASEAASTAPVVLADSTLLADTTAVSR